MSSDRKIHPDLLITAVEEVNRATRYEVWPNGCYLLRARLIPAPGASEFSVVLFSSNDPDFEDFDLDKVVLGSGLTGDADTWESNLPIFFEHGLYIKTTASQDVTAYVETTLIDRTQFCDAYPEPQCTLTECWKASCGRENTPFLDNFFSDSDNARWSNSGTESGGENRITQAGDRRTTQDGNVRVTQQLDT